MWAMLKVKKRLKVAKARCCMVMDPKVLQQIHNCLRTCKNPRVTITDPCVATEAPLRGIRNDREQYLCFLSRESSRVAAGLPSQSACHAATCLKTSMPRVTDRFHILPSTNPGCGCLLSVYNLPLLSDTLQANAAMPGILAPRLQGR
jgi:hypothetical protein